MCLACASAGTVQVIVCALVQIYKCDDHFNINEIANVVLGALVAVTGCNPFIDPRYAILIGGMSSITKEKICRFLCIQNMLHSCQLPRVDRETPCFLSLPPVYSIAIEFPGFFLELLHKPT